MSMTLHIAKVTLALFAVAGATALPGVGVDAQSVPQAAASLPDIGERKTITEADCTATKLGTAIPVAAIGEPVSTVTLSEPRWTAAADPAPAYCTVDGAMAPIDPAAQAHQLPRRPAGVLDAARRAARRRRDERHHPEPHGGARWLRRAGAGHRHLRQRLGPRRAKTRRNGRSSTRRSRTSATCR